MKFADIEGIDSELAGQLDSNEAIQKAIADYQTQAIEEGVKNRVDVAKAEFKRKMDSMDEKLRDAQARADNAPDIDPDELKALKEARDKNPELQATLDALKKRTEEAEKTLQKKEEELLTMRLGNTVASSINEYDTAHPSASVKPDMKDVVSMLARDALKLDSDSGKFRVYDSNGDIVATDKGAATPVDWLVKLRSERPSLFNTPAGSGAPGSTNKVGSAKKYADMTEKERVDLYNTNPEEFRKARGTVENGNNTSI